MSFSSYGNRIKNHPLLPVVFGIVACSWMPHWSCHYYRLETQSTFVVGDWPFHFRDSWLSLFFYSGLIFLNLLSINYHKTRFAALLFSGIFHLLLGTIHVIRLLYPFKFEVFGYEWSNAASWREILIVTPFGFMCILLALFIKMKARIPS